jgi:choline-sulfatase
LTIVNSIKWLEILRPTLPVWLVLACFCCVSSVSAQDDRGAAPDIPSGKGINVLLVTVDTFRPDHLGAYGYGRDTSPVLDSLAADGALFEQTMSSSSWTTPGLLSVLTGQYAPSHGVDVRGKTLRPGTPTIATELGRAGYVTPDILYLSSIPNLQNLGLTSTYADRDQYLPNGDEVLFKALEAYQDSLFFIYYHYRNLHLPIAPAPPYDEMFVSPDYDRDGFVKDRVRVVRENVTIPLGSINFSPQDTGWVRGLYDGQIRQMDETFFRPLLKQLKDLGLYERTLIIVTADHGEELLEHGFIGHPSTSFRGSAYDELIHIPLLMSCPSLIPGGVRVGHQTQNIDILPTVMDLLDLPIPSSVQGQSLVPAMNGEPVEERPAFTETAQGGYQSTEAMMKVRVRAHRAPPWKLIHSLGPGLDRTELYNLERDPEETKDVSADYPEVTDRMRKRLHAWLLTAKRDSVPVAARTGPVHTGDIRVDYPKDGDTLRYVDAEKTVDIRWQGTPDAPYVIEYRVGVGNYHLEGRIPSEGLVSRHGPFTEEMWNMLTLYNPFTFRVIADGSESASEWMTFVIELSGDAAPSMMSKAVAEGVWALSEAGLLVGGLWAGGLLILQAAGSLVLSDLIGWALVLILVITGIWPPLARRIGRNRARRWSLVLVYTGTIYATLSVVPGLWGEAFRLTQGRVDFAVPVIAFGFAIWVVVRIARKRVGGLRPRWQTVGAVLLLAGLYSWLLLWLSQSPAERFHLAEYGVLSLLTYRACRLDTGQAGSVLFGLLVASVLGAGDEMIQWTLPNRVFEWKDVWLNVLSACLGMALVVTLGLGEEREDA